MSKPKEKFTLGRFTLLKTPTYFGVFLIGIFLGELVFGILETVSLRLMDADRLFIDIVILVVSLLALTFLFAAWRMRQLLSEKKQSEAFQRQTLEELRRALTDKNSAEIEVFFQPKISLASGFVEGTEALVRWHHPLRGLIQPLEFVSIVENTDLIHHLTRRVVSLALRQQSKWDKDGIRIDLSVNISAKNLVDPGLAKFISAEARKYAIVPRRITLEVTESAAVADPVETAWALNELRECGFLIASDDFGTGYSSLTSLQTMPFTCVKLDRSFVQAINTDPRSLQLIRSITSLANNLELHTVAEGIEDIETFNELKRLGVDSGQGYLFSRPLPGNQFADWKESWESNLNHYEVAIDLPEFEKEFSEGKFTRAKSEELVSLCYISCLKKPLEQAQKNKIFGVSIENNSKNGITGFLLLAGTTVIQLIEGQRSAIDTLFESISKDQLHSNVQIVDYSTILGRSFGKWEMKFCDLTVHQVSAVLGQSWSPQTFHAELTKNDNALQLLSTVYAETSSRRWDNNTAHSGDALDSWRRTRAG